MTAKFQFMSLNQSLFLQILSNIKTTKLKIDSSCLIKNQFNASIKGKNGTWKTNIPSIYQKKTDLLKFNILCDTVGKINMKTLIFFICIWLVNFILRVLNLINLLGKSPFIYEFWIFDKYQCVVKISSFPERETVLMLFIVLSITFGRA